MLLEKKPSYISLYQSGELLDRIKYLNDMLKSCELCQRKCHVDRIAGELGYCGAGFSVKISSAFAHFGEEAELVCEHGSGTIFLSHCNLLCSFCQNYDISHFGNGKELTAPELAKVMISLQQRGCLNINFVTPTHFAPQIIAALPIAIESGLRVPIVWNCSGYESLEVIRLLKGIIDIYMPDAKFSDEKYAKAYANAEDYYLILKVVLKEMQAQVGELIINEKGAAISGLLIRHLILPNNVASSMKILKFIANELSLDSYVNIMRQYRPCFKMGGDRLLGRAITDAEFWEVITFANQIGLKRGFMQF